MRCPKCDQLVTCDTQKVIDTRPLPARNAIRRRRQCSCGFRFTTRETIVSDIDPGYIDVARSSSFRGNKDCHVNGNASIVACAVIPQLV